MHAWMFIEEHVQIEQKVIQMQKLPAAPQWRDSDVIIIYLRLLSKLTDMNLLQVNWQKVNNWLVCTAIFVALSLKCSFHIISFLQNVK